VASVTSRIADSAARLLLKGAAVSAVRDHGRFRTIELTGPGLRGARWTPGDKVRLRVGSLELRTYTPASWDTVGGRFEVVAFLPGSGPGATWCRQADVGVECLVFGPQRSVRLDRVDRAPILVGDETSIGLVAAWHHHRPDLPPVATVLEVDDPDATGPVLAHHDLAPRDLVVRQPGDAHVAALLDSVTDLLVEHPDAPLCLTGRAQSIAAVRRHLKAEGLTRPDTLVKAYWDPNRSGLD
jgi:NADPH-dependent ferric siderophore reductase